MKKNIFLSLVFSLFGLGFLALGVQAVDVNMIKSGLDGELVKGESYDTIYYLAEDGKRYVFPNSKTYFSWFDDFSDVNEISDDELFSYPLGGNVRYKPGSLLVKITTDPKVYAVGDNGRLRWVKSEEVAKSLYGQNWNKLVDDIPDSFFTNYEIGEEIDSEEDYDPIEAEDENPTISHNRGFKAKKMVQDRVQDRTERRCEVLQESVNKLQKRIEMYGIEVDDLGDDFMEDCVEGEKKKMEKVKVCHTSEEGRTRTLEVSPQALRGLLAERATLGECDEDEMEEEEEHEEEYEDEYEDEDYDDSTSTSSDDMMDDDYDDSTSTSSDDIMEDEEQETSTSSDDMMEDSDDDDNDDEDDDEEDDDDDMDDNGTSTDDII